MGRPEPLRYTFFGPTGESASPSLDPVSDASPSTPKVVPSLLIVDDNEADVFLTQRFLQKSGRFPYVFAAAGGEEAMALFRDYEAGRLMNPGRFPPLVILLDINMPRMDGFEFLEAFSALDPEVIGDPRPAVVLMLSSSNAEQDRERANEFPLVKDFLVKPITVETAISIADQFGTPEPTA